MAAGPAAAYVGPGAGLTLVGALWGLIAALVMTVGFIIAWPFRRFLFARRRNAGGDMKESGSASGGSNDESATAANRAERSDR